MARPARGGPRVTSPQDEFVADLVQRLAEKALLVEERRSDDGGVRLLVVLDVDAETLATEAARAAANGAVAVEIVDLHAWQAMRRLAAMGLLQFTREVRELYRSVGLPADAPTDKVPDGRGTQAMAEADRALRMAKTLADGGFPEEAPALLARSLRAMAAALMAARGETATGAPDASNADICRLVEYGALPTEALAILDATRLLSSATAINGVAPLLSSTTRILAAIGRNEPSLTVRASSA